MKRNAWAYQTAQDFGRNVRYVAQLIDPPERLLGRQGECMRRMAEAN